MSVEPLHPAPEELYAYRDGELSAERRAFVETHVTACRVCRERMDEMSKLEASLRSHPDTVGDAYYERMQAQVMAKVHAAAPPSRAPIREVPLERRRDDVEREERRRGAPKLPWIAVGSAVSAMAAVVVVVVLLVRQGSMPQVAVLERSAPDAGKLGAVSDTSEAGMRGRLAAPPAESPAAPRDDARAKERQLAETKTKQQPTDQVAVAPYAEEEKKDKAAANEMDQKLAVRPESDLMAKRSASKDEARLQQAEPQVSMAAPQASLAPPAAGAGNRYESALSRFGLPPVWGPGVSDDLVLKAEPVFRNLYRTGGATTPLDSARVRLYLAEAARLRAGAAPDSAAIDEIEHHYRRAIRLGSEDPATVSTAAQRLREFLSEIGATP
ncbi:MAG TPA: zf-HC2 domain-containing protein [Candidatus Eisenbacteria bacterium]|nr:zf-HC2 domain-containing protein [Candidatus Eisenbacteria bacterium]